MADIAQLLVAHAHTFHLSESRDLRSLRVTFDDILSGQKAPLGRILRNFRLRMRGTYFRSPEVLSGPLPVT